MKLKPNKSGYSVAVALVAGLLLAGCGGGSSSTNTNTTPIANSYDVTIFNTTNNQPLSPVAIVSHVSSYSAWSVGSAASVGIEYIAEGGSNIQFRDSLTGIDATSVSGTGPVGPGLSQTTTITASAATQTHITIASMLVNTNDAFSGINGLDVSGMASGDTMTVFAKVYDAGTEFNSEAKGTMPGPADKGEGFNLNRTDFNDIVRSHGGVVTADDGLMTSILDQSHRFDNPGMKVTITKK